MMRTLKKDKQRRITHRILIKGDLVLQSPTCIGNGEMDGMVDLNLVRDSLDQNHALLTGSTIAGALRNYVHEYYKGFDRSEDKTDQTTKVFGGIRKDDDGIQSALIVDDAISTTAIATELRDGVAINPLTGTAMASAKYDFELLQSGTVFPLQFELLIDEREEAQSLKQSLAIALQGLENGEISIGMKKRRGFGRCKVESWQVWQFDMSQEDDRTAWLCFDRDGETQKQPEQHIANILNVVLPDDERSYFKLDATFHLAGSMLIRSGHGELNAPDVVHLKSNGKPIISGTSLAGVLRHRATRILNTLIENKLNIDPAVCDGIFGDQPTKVKPAKHSSRLTVDESEIIGGEKELIQTRIAIDRFTGGALNGALFEEQPIFGNDKAIVKIKLQLQKPNDAEVGLLLLLLKDLWTSDLAIGGGNSIGRGRLKGIQADMTYKNQTWKIEQANDQLNITGSEEMQHCLEQLLHPLGAA